MATKSQKAALAGLRALTAPNKPALVPPADFANSQPTAPETSLVDPQVRSKGGRPKEDTEQISLRPPRDLMRALRRRAAAQTVAENRTITPQQVILEILTKALAEDPAADG